MDCAVRREPVPRESRHQANQTAAVHRGLANRPRPRWHRRRWPSGLPFYTPGNGPSMSAKRRNQRCRSAPQQERGARRSACAARGEAQDLSQLGGGKLEAHRPSASQVAVGANWVCRGGARRPRARSQRSFAAFGHSIELPAEVKGLAIVANPEVRAGPGPGCWLSDARGLAASQARRTPPFGPSSRRGRRASDGRARLANSWAGSSANLGGCRDHGPAATQPRRTRSLRWHGRGGVREARSSEVRHSAASASTWGAGDVLEALGVGQRFTRA